MVGFDRDYGTLIGVLSVIMRFFVAINLNKKEKTRIFRAAKILQKLDMPVQWIDPDKYHILLKFLGDIPDDMIESVEQAIGRVASMTRTLDISVQGLGAFPTIRSPELIWIGVDPTPALRCLKQDLEWSLTEYGFKREPRAFHPHLTLGRTKGDDGAGSFRGLDEKAANIDFKSEIKIRKIDLMRSYVSDSDVRHIIHNSAKLGG